jgi:3-hydroxy-9,10-secoandrosta-1,3,5(10)-triene-9,17-dione monooxygenase reductase component
VLTEKTSPTAAAPFGSRATKSVLKLTVVLRERREPPDDAAAFRGAMRHLAGGVSVITAGAGEARTGLTVTSAISLSVSPPTMLICVNRSASAWPVIQAERHFCVNILGAKHQSIADRFAGRDGAKGAERYEGARWRRFATGAFGLEDALAVIDCAVEEIIERHSHGVVIGGVRAVHIGGGSEALIYGHGQYRPMSLV